MLKRPLLLVVPLAPDAVNMFTKIQQSIENLKALGISETRKSQLVLLQHYIQGKVSNSQDCHLNFICTHNSRRSILAQVWAQAMAEYYNIQNVKCYSGGTEATAIYTSILEALKISGFEVSSILDLEIPTHQIKYGENKSLSAFSKVFSHSSNPQGQFAAVMVCSDADENCPLIPHSDARFSLPYIDPKISDGTHDEAQTYLERSLEIATEMKWVFAGLR